MYTVTYGGGGETVRMICGYLGCDFAERNPVLLNLPRMLRIAVSEDGEGDWIRSTFTYAAQEIAAGRREARRCSPSFPSCCSSRRCGAMSRRSIPTRPAGLAGLRDPHVSRALALFHGEIARPWTMDELGREVGLSRSALADRFQRLVGQPPMSYLARWRMEVAAQQLRSTSAGLAQIANAVGYEAEEAFSRAFKKASKRRGARRTWRKARPPRTKL